jgi:hypothetical protein
MAFKAAIWHENTNLLLQTGYNILLVRLLNSLPPKECFYRDENKVWYIDLKHEAVVKQWLRTFGYTITEVDTAVPSADDSFSVLGLLPTASWEVCEAAYKALAKINHPDTGGNEEIMKQINEAWDKIKKIKGK